MRILVFVLQELSPVEHNKDNYNLLGVFEVNRHHHGGLGTQRPAMEDFQPRLSAFLNT